MSIIAWVTCIIIRDKLLKFAVSILAQLKRGIIVYIYLPFYSKVSYQIRYEGNTTGVYALRFNDLFFACE